jgi:hypothetical protein
LPFSASIPQIDDPRQQEIEGSTARAADAGSAGQASHKAEIEKWWPIIKAAGIRAE